jgi:hypothetical protein
LSDWANNGRTRGIYDMITVKRTNNEDTDFKALITELDKELRRKYGNMQDEYDQYNIIENLETVVIIYSDKECLFQKMKEEKEWVFL